MIKERPMLYSTEMVESIIEGLKTKTRRIVKENGEAWKWLEPGMFTPDFVANPDNHLCPYGNPGDIIWVREMLYQNGELGLEYVAGKETIDESIIPNDYGPYGGSYSFRKIPSIHMPKWAARIWLEITDIKVERLHNISQQDAIAEGIAITWLRDDPFECLYKNYINDGQGSLMPCQSFRSLWKSINGDESFNANPWVWVISFKVLSTTGKPETL
jgi:hypothetical protein